MALDARGTSVCSYEAALDFGTGYCAVGANAIGPFPREPVGKCVEKSGGAPDAEAVCRNAHWDLGFLRFHLGT